jgi:hypothetical protein
MRVSSEQGFFFFSKARRSRGLLLSWHAFMGVYIYSGAKADRAANANAMLLSI